MTDTEEIVVPLPDFPQSCIGAPCPVVLATGHDVIVAFYLEVRDPEWDGSQLPRVVGMDSGDEMTAVVTFERPTVHTFGPPNDEAFDGHRLAAKGLEPYGAYEVLNSAWIGQLEVMNSVHGGHDKQRYLARRRHFILTFHDETFECISEGFKVDIAPGSVKQRILESISALDR